MRTLKIIFYGLLAFIETHPFFCLILVLLAVFAPTAFITGLKVVGWIILGILTLLLIVFGLLAWKVYKMKRDMKKRFDEATGGAGFSGNFGGAHFGGFSTGGMSLEELVRQMQAQADAQQRAQQQRGNTSSTTTSGSAQKRVNDKVGDYVDFEEVE
jgi:energy-coupling factor transporter transmembrane protein EcfT